MSVADLILTKPTAMELVDQVPAGQAVVDDGPHAAQGVDPKGHPARLANHGSANAATAHATLCP